MEEVGAGVETGVVQAIFALAEIGVIARAAIAAVGNYQLEFVLAGHVDVERFGCARAGDQAAVIQLGAVGPDLENNAAVRPRLVVDAEIRGEGGAGAAHGVAEIGRSVDADALGVFDAVDRNGVAVAGRHFTVAQVLLRRAPAVGDRAPLQIAQVRGGSGTRELGVGPIGMIGVGSVAAVRDDQAQFIGAGHGQVEVLDGATLAHQRAFVNLDAVLIDLENGGGSGSGLVVDADDGSEGGAGCA